MNRLSQLFSVLLLSTISPVLGQDCSSLLSQSQSLCPSVFSVPSLASVKKNADGLLLSTKVEKWLDSSWVLGPRDLFEYDERGNVIITTSQFWDRQVLKWNNQDRIQEEYNEQDLVTRRTFQRWGANTDEWLFDRRTNFAYDDAGHLLIEESQTCCDIDGDWKPPQNRSVNFWVDGLLMQSRLEVQADSTWQAKSRIQYDYDERGRIIRWVVEDFVDADSSWQNDTQQLTTYEAGRNTEINFKWDVELGEWINISRSFGFYEVEGLITEVLIQPWNEDVMDWESSRRWLISYNEDDNFLTFLTQRVNLAGEFYDWSFRQWTYDDEGDLITLLTRNINLDGELEDDWQQTYIYGAITSREQEEVPLMDLTIAIYPIPARDYISFRASFSDPFIISASVYDMLGRRVLNLVKNGLASGHYTQNFSVAHLSPGMYIIRVETEGQVKTKPFVIVP